MTDPSSKSPPVISPATGSATSSQDLQFGHLPFGVPVGPTIETSGLQAARVSLSQRLAEAGLSTMTDTSGRSSGGLLKSAVLQSALASKLQARTALCGSILYSRTWRLKTTPAQRSIWRLQASALPTSGNGFTGWVTPSTRDWKDTIGMSLQREGGRSRIDQTPRQAGLVVPGQVLSGSTLLTERKGQYNPELARWLMQIPIAWASCAPTEMPSLKK